MTLYFLLHPSEHGSERKVRRGTLMPRTARAIAEALAGKEGNVAGVLEQYFEVDAEPVARSQA